MAKGSIICQYLIYNIREIECYYLIFNIKPKRRKTQITIIFSTKCELSEKQSNQCEVKVEITEKPTYSFDRMKLTKREKQK